MSATVLVGINGGRSSHDLLQTAANVATRTGARLLVAHVVRQLEAHLPEVCFYEHASTEEIAAAVFPDVFEALWQTDVAWTFVGATGDPAVELARLARTHEAQMIVVGAPSDTWLGRLRRLATGSVPSRLARLQGSPVLTLPTGYRARTLGNAIA